MSLDVCLKSFSNDTEQYFRHISSNMLFVIVNTRGLAALHKFRRKLYDATCGGPGFPTLSTRRNEWIALSSASDSAMERVRFPTICRRTCDGTCAVSTNSVNELATELVEAQKFRCRACDEACAVSQVPSQSLRRNLFGSTVSVAAPATEPV